MSDTEGTTPAPQSATPSTQCTERTWCVMASEPTEHAQYHSGGVAHLSDHDPAEDTGWSCWLHEDRDEHARTQVTLEGRFLSPGEHPEQREASSFVVTLPAWQMAALMWATSTPAARASINTLLGQVTSEGGSS